MSLNEAPGESIHLLRGLAEAIAPVAEEESLAIAKVVRGLPRQVAEGEVRGPVVVEIRSVHEVAEAAATLSFATRERSRRPCLLYRNRGIDGLSVAS